MGPDQPLPLPTGFTNAETYVESLLDFGTTSQILQTLCGGVHILDFFTRTPSLYSTILPGEWRAWFATAAIGDVLDLLLREDLDQFTKLSTRGVATWRGMRLPPPDFVKYVKDVRSHLLNRQFTAAPSDPRVEKIKRQVFMGMNPKKIHEVDHFARYMGDLADSIEAECGKQVTHLADFGAGQNYLGRVLASEPYNRHIVAIENRSHVVAGARKLDISAKIAKKPIVMRNKKAYKASQVAQANRHPELNGLDVSNDFEQAVATTKTIPTTSAVLLPVIAKSQRGAPMIGKGTVTYIEHRIRDGNLEQVIDQIGGEGRTTVHNGSQQSTDDASSASSHAVSSAETEAPQLMVMSLHSCGNLVHHGLRTLLLNMTVKAVALVGCCYNLMTERLGPPTHKMHLRNDHPRLDKTGGVYDPDGFPMSERFAKYKHTVSPRSDSANDNAHTCEGQKHNRSEITDQVGISTNAQEGIRLNITARMMAVQAPHNWTETESHSFFTRHFFRAVLQRIFLDKGVVGAPPSAGHDLGCSPAGSSWGLANGDGEGTAPVVIGNLSKRCYISFLAYVRGAVLKLQASDGAVAEIVQAKVGGMSDAEINAYEQAYQPRKKDLSIVWSLMAFSAGVVESMIVTDRWIWLQEQPCVEYAWVEPVFDYALSPRNLVVVGIKKTS